MEKKQLDFNAPFLSVRRFSSPSHASSLTKRKPIEELSKPASVPFHWEQIPGRPKTGLESQIPTPSNTPRLPPGRVSGPTTYNSGDQSIQNDHVTLLEKLQDSLNCNDKSDTESQDGISETDDDSYRVSGYETPCTEPSGTFSIDTQTRDFMMNRFLPAAKAAVLETPKYVVKKPRVVFEEKSKRVVSEEKNRLLDNYGSPYYNEYINGVESEDEDMKKKSRKLSWRIIPQFCAKNSLCLSGPLDKKDSHHKKKLRSEMKNKSCVSQLRRYKSGSISSYRATIDIQCEKTDAHSNSSIGKGEGGVVHRTDEIKVDQSLGQSRSLKSDEETECDDDDMLKLSPLPPPLPKSPSESWLGRTLLSIPLGNAFSNRSHFQS